MSNRKTNTTVDIHGEITANVYDNSRLKKENNQWNLLSQDEKMEVLESESPTKTRHSCNVTTVDLHEYIVRDLHPGKTSPADNITASHAGIGDDASSGVVSSNTNLNNLLVSKQILDHIANGTTLTATFLLESSEANGKAIDEIGIASGDLTNISSNNDVFLLNHASFTEIQKNNKNSITFTIELTFDNA